MDYGGDVVGRGATATTDHIDQSIASKAADGTPSVFWGFVVTGVCQWIWQTRIWVNVHVCVGHAREFLEEWSHQVRAEGTVQADAEWLGMADRVPAGFHGLSR